MDTQQLRAGTGPDEFGLVGSRDGDGYLVCFVLHMDGKAAEGLKLASEDRETLLKRAVAEGRVLECVAAINKRAMLAFWYSRLSSVVHGWLYGSETAAFDAFLAQANVPDQRATAADSSISNG